MTNSNVYLTFEGNAKEAMTFYKECLGGNLEVMPFSQMPPGECEVPKGAENLVLHAMLTSGGVMIMASDNMPGMPKVQAGNNFSINLHCESNEEVDRLFAALSKGGKTTMPAQDVFWGSYFGMVTDRFGINWMFNFFKEKPKH